MLPKTVIKSSGEEEEFSAKKLEKSVVEAGGDQQLAEEIRKSLEKAGVNISSTSQIHKFVFEYLKEELSPIAARYNLRRAIIQLGPTGFPFEKFVGEILKDLGHEVMLNQHIKGECIKHEVDFVAQAKSVEETYIGEVKFHSRTGIKTDSKVSLYVKSRFEDIKSNQAQLKSKYGWISKPWIITNTKFSKDAINYGKCQGMNLTAWSYPRDNGLGEIIDKLGIHPVTALTKLTAEHKTYLIENDVVLCRQIKENLQLLNKLGMNDRLIGTIVGEAEAVSALHKRASLNSY
jgi:hypothetical protein